MLYRRCDRKGYKKMNKNEVQKLDLSVPTDFNINFTPAVISFQGYEELSKRVDQLVNNLKGYQVTAKSYTADKKLRAELNKSAKQLHDRANYFIDLASQDTNKFKDAVNVQVKKLKDVSKQIDDGVKYYDNKVKQDKHDQNVAYINKQAAELGITAEQLPYIASWDNKSYSNLKFETEVDTAIDGAKLLIDQANQLSVGSAPFFKDYARGISVTAIIKSMEDTAYQVEYAKKLREARKAAELAKKQAQTVVKHDTVISKDTGEVLDKIYHVNCQLSGTKQQLHEFKLFCQRIGITVSAVK